jgi:dTDP-4-amino-4,6-dideoxygalactose transaminase
MRVPFVDLQCQYKQHQPQIDAAIAEVVAQADFVGGKSVKAFESAFAHEYGVKHCIGVANGTDALFITLKMLGIGAGDEVITAANSWISTSSSITQTGAKPIFVDVDPETSNIDPRLIEARLNPNTRAILPVHLYGQPAEMAEIERLCQKYNLLLVEDCAQAHFAEYRGKRVGTFGRAGTFSFYPSKNLGAFGDAGCVVTDDDQLALSIRRYSNCGGLSKHSQEVEGVNSRLDSLQAAVLLAKLPYIKQWNKQRQRLAEHYAELLDGVGDIELPQTAPGCGHVFHLYCISTAHRDELQNQLLEQGVDTGIHYPTALPFLPAYRHLGHTSAEFPVAHKRQSRILSLPMFPELTEAQVHHVAQAIRGFFAHI